MSDLPPTPDAGLYPGIRAVLLAARTTARRAVNDARVQAYWQIGRLIVEDEQGGEKRAAYGKAGLPKLATRLSSEFGNGFSAQGLWRYRQFYLEFPILSTAWRELRSIRLYPTSRNYSPANIKCSCPVKKSCASSWSAIAPCWKTQKS